MKNEIKILINQVRENTISGDIEIARMLITFILDNFYLLKDEDLVDVAEQLKNAKNEMASIQNIARILILYADKLDELYKELIAFRKFVVPDYNKIHFRDLFSDLKKPVEIITLSRSSTVKYAIILLYKKNLLKNLYVIHSYPGGEGETLLKELNENGINGILVEDLTFYRYMNNIDIAVTGADAITDKYFINKVGSYLLFDYAKKAGKKTLVLGNPLKKISIDIAIKNKEYEKIPLSLVDKIFI